MYNVAESTNRRVLTQREVLAGLQTAYSTLPL